MQPWKAQSQLQEYLDSSTVVSTCGYRWWSQGLADSLACYIEPAAVYLQRLKQELEMQTDGIMASKRSEMSNAVLELSRFVDQL